MELGATLQGQWFVGDSLKDIEAARAAGMQPVLVRTGNGRAVEESPGASNVPVFDDLGAAVDKLLEHA
jgi:D-glycero-D-manno-heptose 1,7-bisphosphate phosphatase